MTEEESKIRLEESPLKKFQESNLVHPDPKIQEQARKNYREDPETKKLVDEIFDGGVVLQEPIIYKK